MNLKKLELFGFKSFMRKLDIHFSDGITVIVGPNGCGKTNVTDAVRWVLGEANARNLRGTRMEDLIFNGTADYKPLNVAEVELTIDNTSGVLPVDYTEVTITRRVTRGGEPEFLINKVPGRLRDIQDLLMDTGLGSRAYSVIERDMVEMVLADQPEKRRELIEEAAGIHKYKVRERQARRKLEGTDEDLNRISDVLREVERQVRSLKRQVGAAKRFQEVRTRQRELEVSLAMVDLDAMETRVATLRESVRENAAERDGAMGRIAALEADIQSLRGESADADRRLADEQREVDRLADEARAAESDNRVRRERREALAETARRLAREKAELEARVQEDTEARAQRERDEAAHREALTALEQRLQEEEASLERLDSDLGSRREELARAREAVETAAEEVGKLRTELANLETRLTGIEDRERQLGEEQAAVDAALESRRGELEQAEARAAERRQEAERLGARLESALRERDEVEAARESARAEEAQLGAEVESARSALEMLRGLQESYEGYGQGARSLLQRGSFSPLADAVRPTRTDLLPALDAALEGVIECVVAPDAESAVQAVRSLRDGEGRATVLDAAGFRHGVNGAGPAVPSDPAVLGTARSFLDVNGDLAPVLDELLARAVVVETLEDAVRLARSSGTRGLRFVSRDGDWAEYPGIVHGGSPRGSDDTQLLGRAARVTEMGARVADAEGRRAVARERLHELGARREAVVAAIESLRTERDAMVEARQTEERTVERLGAEIQSQEARSATLRSELETLATRRAEISAERERHAGIAGDSEERRRELEEAWRRRESEIVDSSAMRDQAQTACHDLRLEAQRLRGELDKVALEMRRLEESRNSAEEGIRRRDEELAGNDRAAGELGREIEAGEEEASRRAAVLEERKEQRDRVANDRAQLLGKLREIEEERGRWTRLRDESADALHEQELELQRLDSTRSELIGRLDREFDVNLALPGARDTHGALLGAEDEVVEESRRERDELRRQIDRMGAVNLVALEQYEREAKRHDFLRTQKDDLEEAREKLRRTIRKINRTARSLFMQTLEQVQKNFQRTHGTLFEGGQADIRLAGDEDPLHAPIEIFARPRGKRLSNISLLSSGERALTAVAFLFAIYLVKPSPFCILDEVDAPLDDANIGRFLAMLKDVSRKTQFVMITHNKKTMEVADYLYGVTMQEAGISQLVSVKLGEEAGEKPDFELNVDEDGNEVPAPGELVTEASA